MSSITACIAAQRTRCAHRLTPTTDWTDHGTALHFQYAAAHTASRITRRDERRASVHGESVGPLYDVFPGHRAKARTLGGVAMSPIVTLRKRPTWSTVGKVSGVTLIIGLITGAVLK